MRFEMLERERLLEHAPEAMGPVLGHHRIIAVAACDDRADRGVHFTKPLHGPESVSPTGDGQIKQHQIETRPEHTIVQ